MEKEANEKNKIPIQTTPNLKFKATRVSSLKVKSAFKSPVRQDIETKKSVSLQQEVSALRQQEQKLDAEIQALVQQGYDESELQGHIKRLHDYNEMKDIGQMLLGKLALQKGVTTKDLYEQYGLDLED